MNHSPYSISIQTLSLVREGKTIIPPFSLELPAGEHLAIAGPSGSGKTVLAQTLCGSLQHFGNFAFSPDKSRKVLYVAQMHHFKNRSNTSDMYYQQRYNSCDSDDALTATEWLEILDEQTLELIDLLEVQHVMQEPLLQLSNGEHKKLQLIKALQQQPQVLILDQPFIGLDTASRTHLHTLLETLGHKGLTILIITAPQEIPLWINHVLLMSKTEAPALYNRHSFLQMHDKQIFQHRLDNAEVMALMHELIAEKESQQFDNAILMKNVQVNYDGKLVLRHINWQVKKGERWLLHGPNGAGKSTLLSLITADHPQAYANEIYLLDQRRGRGESIWEVKKKMGFVSPELHLYFESTASAFDTVASGLFDTIGLFRKLNNTQEALVMRWLALFGFDKQAHKMLKLFPAGEQRLLLLARALIKNPPLLILDEPCQGLDSAQEAAMLHWIDEICVAGNKTMVFITHYQNNKPACITKTLALQNGAVVED